MSTPESKLAASTKPSLVSTIGWVVFWFLLGVPIVSMILGLFIGGFGQAGDEVAGLTLIGYGAVVVWLWTEYRDHREWSRRNALDYSATQAIDQRLSDVGVRDEPLSDLSGHADHTGRQCRRD